MIPLSTGRILRASTTHEEGIIKKEQVRNSLKYAADAPLSAEVKIAMVVAGLATCGIGALLILGIREVYLYCKAEEKQKEQAELACKIIFGEIKTDVNGESSITVRLSTDNEVVCTERPGGLFISTNGGEELRHPTLDKIEKLQDFFKEDIKKNIDLYVKKNPNHLLIALFAGVAASSTNVSENIRELDTLFDSIGSLNDSASLKDFQVRIDRLEEDIEKKCTKFKDKNLLKVKITPEQKGISLQVTFGNFPISKVSFKTEDSYLLDNAYLALLRDARSNATEDTLLNFLDKLASFEENDNKDSTFNEFQKSICSFEEFIAEKHSDFKGKLNVKLTEQRGVTTFSVKLGDLSIAKSAFRNKSLDVDLLHFEKNVYDENNVFLGTVFTPKTVRGLVAQAIASSDSLSFEAFISVLANFLAKTDENFIELHLRVERQSESSHVTLLRNGNKMESGEAFFEGNLTLNDRLFEKVKIDDTGETFKTKLLDDDDMLRWVTEAKTNSAIWSDAHQSMLNQVNKEELEEENILRLVQDMNRNEGWLSKLSAADGVLPDNNVIATESDYVRFINHCLSENAEFGGLEDDDEKKCYASFQRLLTEDKLAFLADMTISSKKLVDLQGRFFSLSLEKRERVKRIFFWVDTDVNNQINSETETKTVNEVRSFNFHGTQQQFQDKLSALSIQDQALFLVVVDQFYQTPLAAHAAHFVAKAGMGARLGVPNDNNNGHDRAAVYSFRRLPPDFKKPNEVKIEVVCKSMLTNSQVELANAVTVVDDEESGIYTISFNKGNTLIGASSQLSDAKANLTIRGTDKTIPEACKSIAKNFSTAPEKYEQLVPLFPNSIPQPYLTGGEDGFASYETQQQPDEPFFNSI